ncbi:MAG: hypothetical protein HY369_03655 [Candidatus Aenigmarchaeota archaeon]|nr:hypothetical protein [Candidatus Aenigmarchaeota archaeon]
MGRTELPDQPFFHYGLDELDTGILFVGAPKSGKTTALSRVVEEANRCGDGTYAADVRGDLMSLALRVPGALYVPQGEDRFNPLEPPPGVTLREWMPIVSARLTLDLGLQTAGQAYCLGLLEELALRAEAQGTIPTLLDLYELARSKKHTPRSSEEGYRDRLVARLHALLVMGGARLFSVQRGLPLMQAAEDGRLVIVDMRVDKMLADFVTTCRLFWLYHRRLRSDQPFAQRTVLISLDEQRNLIRLQPRDAAMIADIELLFSRSRALGIGFLVSEQVVSMVSPAVVTACRLKLAFNSSPPELLHVARLLGLNDRQARELTTLPPGQCIARLSGDRLPHPFRLTIPFPGGAPCSA